MHAKIVRVAQGGGTILRLQPRLSLARTGCKTTLKEVTRYTAAADRKRMAVEGMRMIEQRTGYVETRPIRFPMTATKLLNRKRNK